jgi:hypothetical protein
VRERGRGSEKGKGGWRELRDEELHNFCPLSNVIKMMGCRGDEMDVTYSKH